MRAQFIASEIGIGLRRNLTMTIAVVMTVAMSLLFLGAAMVAYQQANLSKKFFYDKIEISLFLCGDDSTKASCAGGAVTSALRDGIAADLRANPEVEKVFYESKQQAFENFSVQFKGTALVDTVTADQLPESFRVKLRDPSKYDVVAGEFADRPGVDNLADYRKLLDPLFAILNGFLVGSFALAAFMLAASALLIFNTIRLAAFNRRRETGIMRLVGASSFYIQLPFVLEGVVAALVGTALAFAALLVGRNVSVGWLSRNVRITPYVDAGAAWTALPVMALVGAVIAALASFLTLRRYLKV